jgi:hypothetical protein
MTDPTNQGVRLYSSAVPSPPARPSRTCRAPEVNPSADEFFESTPPFPPSRTSANDGPHSRRPSTARDSEHSDVNKSPPRSQLRRTSRHQLIHRGVSLGGRTALTDRRQPSRGTKLCQLHGGGRPTPGYPQRHNAVFQQRDFGRRGRD